MASQVRVCSETSGFSPWWTIRLSVGSSTTIEEFEKYCTEVGGWRPEDQDGIGAVLRNAASCRNPDIVDYILREKGGKAVVNRGDRFEQTPLFLACGSREENPKYRTVETLLNYGADPNLANSYSSKLITPLWHVAEKTEDVVLAQLLLAHGAQLGCPLSPEGQRVLTQAQAGLADYRAGIHGALDDSLLPPLVDIAAEYAGAPPLQD